MHAYTGRMQAILNVAFPVFAVMGCGYLAGRLGLMGEGSSEALNRYVFYVALPPVFVLAMARAPLETIFNWPFIAAYCGGIALTVVVAVFGARLMFRRKGIAGAFDGYIAAYSNSGYMGIPLFLAAFGQEAVLPVIVASFINSSLFIAVGAATVTLGTARGGGIGGRVIELARALALNPLVMAPVLGGTFAALDADIPMPMVTLFELLGASAGPSALFAIGLFLVGKRLGGQRAEIAWLSAAKLVLHPALTYVLVAWVFEMNPFWAASAVFVAAMPAGSALFVLAQQSGVDVARMSATILVTTVLSIATLSALLVWLFPS